MVDQKAVSLEFITECLEIFHENLCLCEVNTSECS